ncbi:MAG: ferric iron uptake transcriptional regulator [Betaproteobacteria bacterium]|jgi:Fur family transcriptional regulator, ferric uptake regulator|nr:MAG: ferric iron uptake transcriptional regulator [Betaproteobacteria bacterium]
MTTGDQLKKLGLKATAPRKRILDLFESSERHHLSAEDVYRILIGENYDVGLATVYRVLMQFEQAGLLLRHRFDDDKAVFELNPGEHHDHLVCIQCGRVEEFIDAEIEARQHAIATEKGFKIHEHHLTMYVDCTREACPHAKK